MWRGVYTEFDDDEKIREKWLRGRSGDRRSRDELDGGDEGAVGGDVAVGHAGSVEGEGGSAVAVEKNETAGAAATFFEEKNGFLGGVIGGFFERGEFARRIAKKIDGGFGHDDFHDGFAKAGAGDAASGDVGVTTAADEWRIADAAGKFATGAAGGSGGEEAAVFIESYGADSSLRVAAMMLGGVFVFRAAKISFPFGFADEFFGLAELDTFFFGEFLGALGDEHHVRAVLVNGAGGANGVFYALQTRSCAGPERSAVHDDGVTFDFAFGVEMRAEAGVEDRSVFEYDDGGLDGVERGAACSENFPAVSEGCETALFAGVDGFVGNVPRAAVNN